MSNRYNTGNPIESTDVRDMSDNAKNFDLFSISEYDTFTDRFGVPRKTIEGAIRSIGIPIIGNFTTGCTVTDSSQGVQEVGGSVYRWKGVLPKIVPPSSNPSETGGISPSGDWIDIGDASLRGDLESPSGANLIGFKLNAISSLLRTQEEINNDRVSIFDFVPVSSANGVIDNTDGFKAAILHCELTGRSLEVPSSGRYLVGEELEISQYIQIYGDSSGLQDLYFGKTPAGTHIKFTGTGSLFYVKPHAPNPALRRPYGTKFSKLVIQGTSLASYGIKVSDAANINNGDLILSGISVEDVFAYDFKSGRGMQINWCFGNNIKNYETQNCAIGLGLNFAHRTTLTAGSLEQCLMGLDAVNSYDVTLSGTGLQGNQKSRETTRGLTMPSDLLIWPGWDGAGFNGISKTTPADYSGTGVRNIGSHITWIGGYEEGNDVSLLGELNSHTKYFGRYVDLDTPVTYFACLGAGTFVGNAIDFVQGGFANLIGVFHQEKAGAVSRVDSTGGTWDTAIPEAKKFTGYDTASGDIDRFNPSAYHGRREMRDYDLIVKRGHVESQGGFKSAGGFDKKFFETKSPPTSAPSTVDIGVGTTGTNIVHLVQSTTVTISAASIGDRGSNGVPLTLHLINNGISNSDISFSGTWFRVSNGTYTIPSNKQVIFSFIHSNGLFIQVGTPSVVDL